MVETEGGGRIGLCRMPGRSGDLAGDVAAVRRFGPRLVVSLTGGEEMARLGAGKLAGALAASGIAWRSFPIVDFGVPGSQSLDAWNRLAVELHAALDAGQSVLLHCHGGLGRSGMVALRLLVERGEAGDAALARIRQARPGAVETEEQRLWGVLPFPEGEGMNHTIPTTGLGR